VLETGAPADRFRLETVQAYMQYVRANAEEAVRRAVAAPAASQGTMNNFTLGSEDHQYYETICGGTGAGLAFEGKASGAPPRIITLRRAPHPPRRLPHHAPQCATSRAHR
jgi:hypothetical protein